MNDTKNQIEADENAREAYKEFMYRDGDSFQRDGETFVYGDITPQSLNDANTSSVSDDNDLEEVHNARQDRLVNAIVVTLSNCDDEIEEARRALADAQERRNRMYRCANAGQYSGFGVSPTDLEGLANVSPMSSDVMDEVRVKLEEKFSGSRGDES